MQPLTPYAEQGVQNLAQRYGVSVDAVQTLLAAVAAGGGTMAQFYHSELGGGGQWMLGGMTMVGDMFNGGLQSRVAGLCSELSSLLSGGSVFAPSPQSSGYGFSGGQSGSSNWWPAELGSPSSSGGQNQSRYAYFPHARRLAIEAFGQVTLYDTLDHQIGGVQQQQGGANGSLSFSSQFGTFTVDSLPRVDSGAGTGFANNNGNNNNGSNDNLVAAPGPASVPAPVMNAPETSGAFNGQGPTDILSAIERLGQLHQQGLLSGDEFRSKKAELLARL
jgi:Short C-terminal domain